MFGVGVTLLYVATSMLIPAVRSQSIPTTGRRRIRRDREPGEFWATCTVMTAVALTGLWLILGPLVG